ncbi:MAG: FG-GAP repeat protein, partial [Bacteroidota bacterium]
MGSSGFAARLFVFLGGGGLQQGAAAFKSGNPLDGFTSSFDNAGDVNGDGVEDIIIGASGYYINGANRGFFGIYSGDTVLTDVSEPEELPQGFELKQNYPNPFNPGTTIEYSIEKQEFVVLKIFDSLGREVTSLVNRQQLPGNYKVTWNG